MNRFPLSSLVFAEEEVRVVAKKRVATDCKSIEKAAKLRRRLQRKKKKREKRADPPTAH